MRPKKFTQFSTYNTHLVTHSHMGANPHKCDIFHASHSRLKVHMQDYTHGSICDIIMIIIVHLTRKQTSVREMKNNYGRCDKTET